jgi:hypothetical protein
MSIEIVDADSLSDGKVRALLETYAKTVGATTRVVSSDLVEIVLPPAERRFFASRPGIDEHGVLRIGVTLKALESDPGAELAVIGSPLFEHVVEAIRSRGHRLSRGVVPAQVSPDATAARLEIPLHSAVASLPQIALAVHPIGRLLVRVLVRAGAAAEELLVESVVFDLARGRPIDPTIVALCDAESAPEGLVSGETQWLPEKPVDRLLALMVSDLEERLRPEFEKRRSEADRSLTVELERIDEYYRSLLDGPAGTGTEVATAGERGAFEAEHQRRRDEETRRHQLRATLHPVQLTRWGLVVQDASWELTTSSNHRGVFTATRPLSGAGTWQSSCPSCGEAPSALTVCKYDHACCTTCSADCSVCTVAICREHAPDPCHIDGAPVCDAHSRICLACRRPYCEQHQALCADGAHPVCLKCSVACGVCARKVCTSHAEVTASDAPKGERALCSECVVLCEGGTNEPVGTDEVLRCATCERHVCGRHQAACVVDDRIHCSAHLRRADRSRRLICEKHRTACSHEPNAVFAVDEIGGCAACSAQSCSEHGGNCSVDGARFCRSHLVPLADKDGVPACESHRERCYIDGQSYSLGSAQTCGICAEVTCREHRRMCGHCGRAVCFKDIDAKSNRCATCKRLNESDDIPVEAMAAAIVANGGLPPKAKSWNMARDKTAVVVDVDLGWSRHLVFTVRHGEDEPSTVVSHSLLGSKRSR